MELKEILKIKDFSKYSKEERYNMAFTILQRAEYLLENIYNDLMEKAKQDPSILKVDVSELELKLDDVL